MAVTLTTEEVVAIAEEAKGYQERISELESENRQLKRALWLARAMRAKAERDNYETESLIWNGREDIINKWHNVYNKCLERMDKYKEQM